MYICVHIYMHIHAYTYIYIHMYKHTCPVEGLKSNGNDLLKLS